MRIGLLYCHALAVGGYPRDVRWLVSSIASHGVRVRLFAERGDETEGLDGAVEVHLPSQSVSKCADVDVVHVFAPLIPRHVALMARILARGKPVVLSTAAQLMPFAMRKSRLKKELYLRAASPWIRRAALHAFGPAEESSLRERFPGQRIFQASLGLFPDPVAHRAVRSPRESGPLRLLFFGRNDRIQKGLDILLPAFSRALRQGTRALLTISGRPCRESERYITQFIAMHGLGESVVYRGEVEEETRLRLMADSDFLVFLSRWDGPPRPVRQAIACGLPVVVSPETNMGHLVERFDAGVQVPLDVERVAECFRRLARSDTGHERCREGARALEGFLSWDRVAGDYIAMYRAVAGGK